MSRARKRCDPGECGRFDWEARIADLEAALRKIETFCAVRSDASSSHSRGIVAIIRKVIPLPVQPETNE